MINDETVELDLPEGVEDAKQAVEVLRAFIGDGALLVSLNSTAFGDNLNEWGRMLAEIGHHVVRAASLSGEVAHADALRALREGFDRGIVTGHQTVTGHIKGMTKH